MFRYYFERLLNTKASCFYSKNTLAHNFVYVELTVYAINSFYYDRNVMQYDCSVICCTNIDAYCISMTPSIMNVKIKYNFNVVNSETY